MLEFRLFLSSPRDVSREREIAKRLAAEVNEDPAYGSRCRLTVLAYEDCVPSQMGKPAQHVVDDFMRRAADSDLVVCMLANRLGTPTTDPVTGRSFRSGTHYELDSAIDGFRERGSPRVMLYLGYFALPRRASNDEFVQFGYARDFKDELARNQEYEGLVSEYESLEEFEAKLRKDLQLHLNSLLPRTDAVPSATPPNASGYLAALCERFRWCELQGISDAGTLRIELEKVYVALKADPESEDGRRQAARLHSVEVADAAGVASLREISAADVDRLDRLNIRRMQRPRRADAGRSLPGEVRTLGDAFRTYRRLVILGGPGSGKSTLGRWLVLQFAKALIHQPPGEAPHVLVPALSIDPDATDPGATVDLGSGRLPVFLRIAHYARELSEREQDRRPSCSLDSFLGRDLDSLALDDGLTADERNGLIRRHLAEDRAIVVLDGLDELTESNRRQVVLEIRRFIETHAPRRAGGAEDMPCVRGGNQVVVTSRFVGYGVAPLQADCAHFGIQPMERTAVERFVRSWTGAVNSELRSIAKEEIDAEALIAEIYDDTRPAVRELAENPLLVTILATVFHADRRLPDLRAGLYHRVVENLITVWLRREECLTHRLTRDELLAALEPLAAEMHDDPATNGLIGLDRIGELVEGPLAAMRQTSPADRRFWPVRDALVSTLAGHFGLLVEQSPDNYAFLHRTFQEFLAARHLLSDRSQAARKIVDQLDDPLWREPLLLAIGLALIDSRWGRDARRRLLSDILSVDESDAVVPRGALLLAAALPDFRDAPADILNQTIDRLLAAVAAGRRQVQPAGVGRQIDAAFRRIRTGPHAGHVERRFVEVLRRGAEQPGLAAATAEILMRLDWFSEPLVEGLLFALPHDASSSNWAIRKALQSSLGRHPCELPWIAPRPSLDLARIGAALPMRRHLEANPSLVDFIRSHSGWLRLMITLYGGLTDLGWLERYRRLQTQYCEAALDRTTATPLSESEVGGVLQAMHAPGRPCAHRVEFHPEDLTVELADEETSRRLRVFLARRAPARDLVPFLHERWLLASSIEGRAEALLGLAALGVDVTPFLRESLERPELAAVARRAIERFAFLSQSLAEPLVRTQLDGLNAVPGELSESRRLDLLFLAQEQLLAAGSSALSINSGWIPEKCHLIVDSPEGKARLDAEFWTAVVSCATADGSYNAAVILDTVGRRVAADPEHLVRFGARLSAARNHGAVIRLEWPRQRLGPSARPPRDRFLAFLDSVAVIPGPFDFVGGFLLGAARPFLEAHPELLSETLAVALGRGGRFLRSFEAVWKARADGSADAPLSLESPEAWRRQTEHISDPYLQFRAEWRFARDVTRDSEALLRLLVRAATIADPHDFVQAWECVFATLPFSSAKTWRDVVRAANAIPDPEDRARALFRLALFSSGESQTLAAAATDALESIVEPRRLAETIREARGAFRDDSELMARLDAVAGSLDDSWLRDVALDRPSRLVLDGSAEHSAAPLAWSLVFLRSVAAEVASLASRTDPALDHWSRLESAELPDAIAALEESGWASGLQVTGPAFRHVERLAARHVPELERLWPLLERPDVGTLSTIAGWRPRTRSGARWAALVQAEAGHLTPETVAATIDTLETSTDRLRQRAAIALHGRIPSSGSRERRWSVRNVGAETLELVAERALGFCVPSVATALNWTSHDWRLDSSDALGKWLRHGASDGPASRPAIWLLRATESIDPALAPDLVKALHGCKSFELSGALVTLAARVANHDPSQLTSVLSSLREALGCTSPEVRESIQPLADAPAVLLRALREACDNGHTTIQACREITASRRLWIDDDCLVDDVRALERLRRVGGAFYIPLAHYWENASKAAIPLAENSQALELLLDWILVEHAESSDLLPHLVVAAEALTRSSTAAFAAVSAPEVWEPLLAELVCSGGHWTARQAAMTLLGRLRRVTGRVTRAVRAALQDVSFVQRAAYAACSGFRNLEGDLLADLIPCLDDPSAAMAAATSRLLAGIAVAERTAAGDRRRILESLRNAAARPSARRPVHLLEETGGVMRIRYEDRLDNIMRHALYDIVGS